jgi:glycosyltransferase involved in cell wall biosynthesis
MKVCKVVINSVSHDARVLKEAEAVKELGHDVVIIGIQDANVPRPIDVLENGVTILRVAWRAAAVKPSRWVYLLGLLGALMGAVAVFRVLHWLWAGGLSLILELLLSMSSVVAIGTVSLGVLLTGTMLVASSYRGKARRFRGASKSENDNQLKHQAQLDDYLKRLQRAGAHVPKPKSAGANETRAASPAVPERRPTGSWISRHYPRPIMAGLSGAFSARSLNRWKTVWARERLIWQLLEQHRPAIVHAHDVSALSVCAEYKRATGCKLVFDAHEVYDHLAQAEDDLAEVNGKIMAKYQSDVDVFVTINESIADYYRVHYPGFPKAIIVKNATPRADVIAYDGRLHRAAGIAADRRILIYQGGFAPKRGLLQLLLAAEHLQDDWCLVFMGWGRLEPLLRQTADAMRTRIPGLADRVRFVPRVPQRELPYWTTGAALGVIPYENVGLNHWFCTPNKLWEYPNAGVPIVSSPFPELRRIIEPNEIGWFMGDPLSPQDIAKAVNALTPEMLSQARQRCLEFIASDNWDVYASRLKNAYRTL